MNVYTVEELIPLLRISKKGIRTFLAQGKLKGRKVGKRWLVSEEALREFLLQCDHTSNSSSPVAD